MAEKDREVIIVDVARQQQEQFARRRAELAQNPLDRAKRPGGYYLNADGMGAHDAEGRPVPLLPEDKEEADRLKKAAEARAEQAAAELVPADSPEELADRGVKGGTTGTGTFTPAAVEPGTVLPDGSTSQPGEIGKAAKPAAKPGSK